MYINIQNLYNLYFKENFHLSKRFKMLAKRASRTDTKRAVDTLLLLACIIAAGFSSANEINLNIWGKVPQE